MKETNNQVPPSKTRGCFWFNGDVYQGFFDESNQYQITRVDGNQQDKPFELPCTPAIAADINARVGHLVIKSQSGNIIQSEREQN